MNIEDVNQKIEDDYDENISNLLRDKNLMDVYKDSKCIRVQIELLKNILNKYNIENFKHDSIINEIINITIPAGLKGATRGNLFNKLVKNEISGFDLQKDRFHVCFEKKNENYPTDEIPDWFIQDQKTSKLMIGLNQIDLWGGGAQLNRGSKYILNTKDDDHVKFLCVVASRPKPFKNTNSKCYKICKTGFESNSLCFIKNLKQVIYDYFEYSNVGLKRNPIDKFYTKPEVARLCMERIKQNISISRERDLIVEPSAGNGSFIPFIKDATDHFLFLDISPQNEEIIRQDFLNFQIGEREHDRIHVVGNPPFGRQSSLAFKFLKKSMEFADTVSFILPRSFRKQSNQEKINLFFHLIFEMDLCNDAFLIDEMEYNVPCIFQIWIKKEVQRTMPPKLEPTFFQFVKKHEFPDIAFRRVGINAGQIYTDTNDRSEESHYFIKFTNNVGIEANMKRFDLSFDFNNHTGPRSISKQELLSLLREDS